LLFSIAIIRQCIINSKSYDKNEVVDAIKKIVLNKYPYLEGTLKDLSVNKKGGFSQWTLGFRYIMQIGIAF